MSFDLNVFTLLPFPVRVAIQAITSFICTEGQRASSFCSCMSHIMLPVFLEGQTVQAAAFRRVVESSCLLCLKAPCPTVCITAQSVALHSLVGWHYLAGGLLALTDPCLTGHMSKTVPASHCSCCWSDHSVQVSVLE